MPSTAGMRMSISTTSGRCRSTAASTSRPSPASPTTSMSAAPLPGAGTGLIGLAERVSLAGGTLEHGVDPDGAFVLRASLPR